MFNHFQSVRLVYSVHCGGDTVVDPIITGRTYAVRDPTDGLFNAFILGKSNLIKGVQAHASSNIIIEVQVPRPGQADENFFVSFGWTLLNLFDIERRLNAGLFQLPLYQAPVRTGLDVRDIDSLRPISKVVLCLRMGHVAENIDTDIKFHDPNNGEQPNDYAVPDIHGTGRLERSDDGSGDGRPLSRASLKSSEEGEQIALPEEEAVADDKFEYEGAGIILKIHSIYHY